MSSSEQQKSTKDLVFTLPDLNEKKEEGQLLAQIRRGKIVGGLRVA